MKKSKKSVCWNYKFQVVEGYEPEKLWAGSPQLFKGQVPLKDIAFQITPDNINKSQTYYAVVNAVDPISAHNVRFYIKNDTGNDWKINEILQKRKGSLDGIWIRSGRFARRKENGKDIYVAQQYHLLDSKPTCQKKLGTQKRLT